MALIKADRVKETSTSETTANFILGGAATGYRTFSSVCAVGDTFYYAISNQSNGEWEVGLGTYGVPNILERTTVHASSNAGNKVNFSSGTKECFISATKAWLDTFITQTSGTTNYVAKTTGTGTIGDSQISDNGTNVGIGVSPAASKLDVGGTISSNSKEVATYVAAQSTLYIGGITSSNTAANVAFRAQSSGGSDTTYMYIAQGGNVGIGTASPAERLHLYKSGDAIARIEGTTASIATFHKNSVYCGYIGAGSTGTNDLFIYNLASAAVRINNKAVYVTSSDTVGINETSPGAQLQVTTAAAATKGLIVKGASGQSARYIELQDSTGTVIAGVNSAGMGEFNGVYSGENGKVQGFNGIELQAWNAGAMRSAAYVYKDLNMQIGGTITPNVNIGSNQLLVVNSSPSWAALRVKGASGQSANLQEWQNNSGTVLASIASDGGFSITNSTAYISRDSVYTDYVGQLVLQGATNNNKRLALGADTTNNIAFLQSYINSVGPAPLILNPNNVGTGSNTVGVGNVTSPDGQFHVTTHISSRKVLVARAHASQSVNIQEWQNSSGNAYAAVNNQFGAQFHGWSNDGPHGGVEQVCLSAGLKSYWASGDAALMTIGFVDIAGVYDGTNWSMYFKTGSSGSRSERMRITSTGNVGIGTTSPAGQLHTQATASTNKALIVRGASGQNANLQEWQNNSGTTLASVDSSGSFIGNIYSNRFSQGYFAKIATTRSLPTTVGDYVEICNFTEQGGKYTIVIFADQPGVGQVAKKYEFVCAYGVQQGVIAPIYSVWSNGTTTPPNDFQLEVIRQPSAYDGRIRIKRVVGTAAITLNVNVEYNGIGSLTEYSGTGTSSLTSYTNTYSYQMYVAPPPPSGNSYSGNDLWIYGGTAAGTGNGGNILLQAGAYATSGSNGKVIVRGLASNTANLQEWQNNAGTALAKIDSSGNLTSPFISIDTSSSQSLSFSTNGTSRWQIYHDGSGNLRFYDNVWDNTDRMVIGAGGNIVMGAYSSLDLYNGPKLLVTTGPNSYGGTGAARKGLVVRGSASQTANLQEWQNSSGTALASVDASGNINAQAITNFGRLDTYFDSWYGSINRRVYRVTVPSTIGNYQEIFKLNWSSNTIAKIKVYAFGSGIFNAKEYDFNSTYGSEGVLLPSRSAYLYNTISVQYELESKWDPATGYNTIRVKRTAGTDALSLLVYVEVLDATSGHPIAASGTGTSSIGGILGSYSTFNSIAPPDVVGGNGSGYNLNLYGGAGLGTGNGGSIILQAGAYSTSGSNGKVIVRGLAGNTANLQEWQNNAGSTLSAVKADGSIQPASLADSAATNNSIYYSTTAGKLVYKDSSGTVNNLY